MTNKEAIEELRELIEIDLHPCPPIYEEALNLAIKALEERPQGEWINKAEVLSIFDDYIDGSIAWGVIRAKIARLGKAEVKND